MSPRSLVCVLHPFPHAEAVMSRSYRIKVRESLRRVIKASDHVGSQLELLEILAPEQMAELLAKELVARGFERSGTTATRTTKGVTVTVDLECGEVTVRSDSQENLKLETERDRIVYEERTSAAEKDLRDRLKESLEKDAQDRQTQLQKQVTDRLERELGDVKKELDGAVNRATAEALKVKAAQMGQIKSLTEDPSGNSLTIIIEV